MDAITYQKAGFQLHEVTWGGGRRSAKRSEVCVGCGTRADDGGTVPSPLFFFFLGKGCLAVSVSFILTGGWTPVKRTQVDHSGSL